MFARVFAAVMGESDPMRDVIDYCILKLGVDVLPVVDRDAPRGVFTVHVPDIETINFTTLKEIYQHPDVHEIVVSCSSRSERAAAYTFHTKSRDVGLATASVERMRDRATLGYADPSINDEDLVHLAHDVIRVLPVVYIGGVKAHYLERGRRRFVSARVKTDAVVTMEELKKLSALNPDATIELSLVESDLVVQATLKSRAASTVAEPPKKRIRL